MGQALSNQDGHQTRTREELRRELADRFAEKCFTSIELYSLKDNFKSLADSSSGVRHLREDTLAKFLELPDILHVSPVVFQMVTFLGAFPFLEDAPAVLMLPEAVMVVSLMTERHQRILVRGATNRRKLLFKSLAVYDRKLSEIHEEESGGKEKDSEEVVEPGISRSHAPGFVIDETAEDGPEGEEDDDDQLVLSAFQSLDYVDAFKLGSQQTIHGAMIPGDNFRKLIMLLLLIAPLGAQESISQYPDRFAGEELESVRSAAESILAAFLNVEKSPGIKFKAFSSVLPASLPYMFDGFNALFERFLFSKNLDFTKHKEDGGKTSAPALSPLMAAPLLQDTGSILNLTVLSQLSFFIPGSSLFRRLRLLYSGDKDGFSMGSFETSVFNWRAPTIVLVRGNRISDSPSRSEERFAASLPPKRFPDGSKSSRLTFGLYVSRPWRHSNKECFGETDTLLFQLGPVHDVFPASKLNKNYVSFMRPGADARHTGIAVGSPLPKASAAYRRQSITHLGPVSLLLDSSFEFGVFTHDYDSRGGAFQNSVARRFNFQDRFEIEDLEVWGCGGDEEAEAQVGRWAFEAREAEARRRINLSTGDIEADRALLEMAGLIGQNRSGGSMA